MRTITANRNSHKRPPFPNREFSKRETKTLPRPVIMLKPPRPITDSFSCPYCGSRQFIRRGWRQKKHERVQLYLCDNTECHKTFTPHTTRGKHYPLRVILEAVSTYNLGYSLAVSCRKINQRFGFTIHPSTLAAWLAEFNELCHFSRMRPYAMKLISPQDMIVNAVLAHKQFYCYGFHRAKCELLISEEFKHHRYRPLQKFLELVPTETPHQYYLEELRSSKAPLAFSKKQMIVRTKQNYATRLAAFVLQSVQERTGRHEAIQRFMLANDSVTVAVEVPVYILHDDLEHMQTQLGFEFYTKPPKGSRMAKQTEPKLLPVDQLPNLITGHIDFVQIRNGQIHILDYKPNAAKEQPIEQLTLYAMALSRLTGLSLFDFKCAWFDELDYFEFFPLHVLRKPQKNRRRKHIKTREGNYIINQDMRRIVSLQPEHTLQDKQEV